MLTTVGNQSGAVAASKVAIQPSFLLLFPSLFDLSEDLNNFSRGSVVFLLTFKPRDFTELIDTVNGLLFLFVCFLEHLVHLLVSAMFK